MKELLYQDKKKFIRYVIACLFPVVIDLFRIAIISMIFESVERMNVDFFRLTIIAVISFLVISVGAYILSRMMRISYMRDTLYRLRVQAFEKIMRMDYKQYHQKSRDIYISNLLNDINTFEQSFFLSLINFIFRCGIYISILTILIFLNWRIAVVVFAASVLVLIIAKIFEKKTVSLQKEVSKENEDMVLQTSNTFNGLEILKLNNIEDTFLDHSKNQIHKLEKKKFGFRFFSTMQLETNAAIGYILFVGLLIYLMYLTQEGIGYGELVLVVLLSSTAVFSLVNMMPLINVLKSSAAIYEKITKRDEQGDINGRHQQFSFNGKIQVQDLRFGYDGRTLLHDVSFTLEKGKKYLLKGASGSGKSSIIKLLSGIYDDYEGTIQVDGVDMKSIQTRSFYDKVSYIYQDVFLFEANLEENISLFKKVDPAQLEKAVQSSGLQEFVETQGQQYKYMIEENGKNLSGGERQRVSIARALYKKADILFIDEATSSLNDELGRAVEQTIVNLEATVVAISHKYFPGITNQYDYVLEIKDGFVTQYESKDYFMEVQ